MGMDIFEAAPADIVHRGDRKCEAEEKEQEDSEDDTGQDEEGL